MYAIIASHSVQLHHFTTQLAVAISPPLSRMAPLHYIGKLRKDSLSLQNIF